MSADFWGVVVPTWLGALGTIAASTVALFAYLAGRSAQGGVKELANGLNSTSERSNDGDRAPLRGGGDQSSAPEPWLVEDDGRKVTFRNASGLPVVVTRVRGTGVPLTAGFSFPLAVPPTAAFAVQVHRILGGPAVTGVTLDWSLEDGREYSRTYYL